MTKSDKHTLLLYYIHTHVTKVVSSNYMSCYLLSLHAVLLVNWCLQG